MAARKTRYKLRDIVNFIGLDEHRREVVITVQSWKNDAGTKGIYVKTHNGVEVMRRFYEGAEGAAMVQCSFNLARQGFTSIDGAAPAFAELSVDGAADEIVRRGGPNPQWCRVGECGAQIPYAAAACAEGHPLDQLPVSGSYALGSSRRPTIMVPPQLKIIQGGRQ